MTVTASEARGRSTKRRLMSTLLMVVGMLIVAAVATPAMRAAAWMALFFSMPPFVLSNLIMNRRPPSNGFTGLVLRPLIVVAIPTVIASILIIRAVADLNVGYVAGVLVVVVGGTLIGSALNKLTT